MASFLSLWFVHSKKANTQRPRLGHNLSRVSTTPIWAETSKPIPAGAESVAGGWRTLGAKQVAIFLKPIMLVAASLATLYRSEG